MMIKICQCCHVPIDDGMLCQDCADMSELTRQVTTEIIKEFNPIFRRRLSAVLLKDKDIFVAALLRYDL